MIDKLASELSPAISLISDLSCSHCQTYAVKFLFYQALIRVQATTEDQSWQRFRQYAILSPLYLEVIQTVLKPPFTELLLAARQWQLKQPSSCPIHLEEVLNSQSFLIQQQALYDLLDEIIQG